MRLRRERQGLIGIITPAALFWTAHTRPLQPKLLYIVPTKHHETTAYRLHPISLSSVYSNANSIQLPFSRPSQTIDQSPTYPSNTLQSGSCPTGRYKRHCCVIVRHSTRTELHCGRLYKQALRQLLRLQSTAHTHLQSPWPQLMSPRDRKLQRGHPSGALLPPGSRDSQASKEASRMEAAARRRRQETH